jgi:hypothetical protein
MQAFKSIRTHMRRWVWPALVAIVSLQWMPSAAAVEGRYALIVGIGNYSEASRTEPLKGIPKDVDNARRMALSMGVDPRSIVEIRDAQATKGRVLRELERLRKLVKPGDRVLVYWSGHGARYAAPKGCVEGLQTYTEGPFTEEDVLSEAELAAMLQPISRVADKVIAVIDACFSGGVIRGATRSLSAAETPRAKFNAQSDQRCDVGVNQVRTRSLLAELSRLGVHQENFVQIASANYDEVSWDTEMYGGFATHSLTQCLLGEAKDLNRSGAVSLDELRVCAQSRMNRLMEPHRERGMLASTLQIKGNRNLVVMPAPVQEPPVVAAQTPPASPPPVVTPPRRPPPASSVAMAPPVATPPVATPPVATPPVATPPVAAPPVATPPVATPPVATPPVAAPPVAAPPVAAPPAPVRPAQPPLALAVPQRPAQAAPPAPPVQAVPMESPVLAGPVGSRATLEDLYNQRDPRITLSVEAPRQLRIDTDPMTFTVRPNADGYLYVVMLGSDEKSFYLLFPNRLDGDHRVRAHQTYTMPRPGWQLKAAGPPGVDRLLFLLSPSARDAKLFPVEADGAGGPFAYSVADLVSRQRLIDFFLGRGVKGRNGAMGAALIEVEEIR